MSTKDKEVKRLEAICRELKDKVTAMCAACGLLYHRCVKYEEQTRELIAALELVLDDPSSLEGRPRTYEIVVKAIAKAKGQEE